MKVFKECEPGIMVQLSNGEVIGLEDLVKRYEALSNQLEKKAEPLEKEEYEGHTPQKLEVGVWFLIDRNIIESKMKTFEKACKNLGRMGVDFFERCQKSLQEAKKKPEYYTPKIETYIFEKTWAYKTEQELRDMCFENGEGQTNEIIADLELMMRFCNGETVDSMINNADTLPRVRVITLTSGGTGYLGGGVVNYGSYPPADLYRLKFDPIYKHYNNTTSAFRRVL